MGSVAANSQSEVLLIVGGGIAAYKSAIVARELLRLGYGVQVVMTEAAKRFIGEVTFAGLTANRVYSELWDAEFSGELHVALAERAAAIVVAPATADLLSRAANGVANDLATATLLCAKSPVIFAPAMHERMWDHPATAHNVAKLLSRGARITGPVDGPLANGTSGRGRMQEPELIAQAVSELMTLTPRSMAGVNVLITAGPTYEPLDPVRFIGNRSSGRMGIALADRAAARGANVTLVHGPIQLVAADPRVQAVAVQTAQQMFDAVMERRDTQHVIVMAAAVADYRPAVVAEQKMKKSQEDLSIRLVKNQDILATLGQLRGGEARPVLVGFAVETTDLVAYARSKLSRKGCDLIVANLAQDGFEGQDNVVTLVSADDAVALPKLSKPQVAERIWDRVERLLNVVAS